MVRILLDTTSGEDVEADARRLHYEYMEKNKLPRLPAATRAIIPSWCDACGERCWGPISGYAMCAKCRGEGKVPLGFGIH